MTRTAVGLSSAGVSDPPIAGTDEPARVWAVARAIARIEGRRLLRSPLVIVGLALILVHFQRLPVVVPNADIAANFPFTSLLLAAGTLSASCLATLRGKRHDAEELFGATSASPRARTAGHLLAVAWPTAVGAVLVAGTSLFTVLVNEGYGPFDAAEVAVGPLLVAGAGCLGVLLARWVPNALVIPVACLAIAFFELHMNTSAWITSGWRWMAFWLESGDHYLLPARPARWHLVYLLGLIGMAAVGALLRHGISRRLVVAGGAVVAIAAVGAGASVGRPSEAGWASRNRIFSDPASVQDCEERDGIRYCRFEWAQPMVARWAEVVNGVRAATPASAWPAQLEVAQRIIPEDIVYTRERLRRVLPGLPDPRSTPVPDDGNLHPGRGWERSTSELALGLAAASRVVGLPLAPPGPSTRCDASGQGRAAIALWLAGQATPGAAKALRRQRSFDLGGGTGPRVVPGEVGAQGAVAWGVDEVRLAVALLQQPAGDVRARLARDWVVLTGRATPTAEVAKRLGVDLGTAPALAGSGNPAPDVRLAGTC